MATCCNCAAPTPGQQQRCQPCVVWRYRHAGQERPPHRWGQGRGRLAGGRACGNCGRVRERIVRARCDACLQWRKLHAGQERPAWRWTATRGRPAPPHDTATCRCRSCGVKRAWAAGKYAHVRYRRYPHWNDWQPRHDQRLRELAGSRPLSQIAACLLAEFGIPRTLNALRDRCAYLGVSQHAGLTLRQVAQLCGVHHGTVSHWIREGVLSATPVQPGPTVTQWWIPEAALETFLRTYPERLAWQRMPPSRYRALVEVEWRRDPFWTRAQVQQFVGATPAAIIWAQRSGRLPAVRSHRWSQWGGQWFYRRSAVLAWQRQRTGAA